MSSLVIDFLTKLSGERKQLCVVRGETEKELVLKPTRYNTTLFLKLDAVIEAFNVAFAMNLEVKEVRVQFGRKYPMRAIVNDEVLSFDETFSWLEIFDDIVLALKDGRKVSEKLAGCEEICWNTVRFGIVSITFVL